MNKVAVLVVAALCVAGARADMLSIKGATPIEGEDNLYSVCDSQVEVHFDPNAQNKDPLKTQKLWPDYLVLSHRLPGKEDETCSNPPGSNGYVTGEEFGACSKVMQSEARHADDKSLIDKEKPFWFYDPIPGPILSVNFRGNGALSGWGVRNGVTCGGMNTWSATPGDANSKDCKYESPADLFLEGQTYDLYLAAYYSSYQAYGSYNMISFKYEPEACVARAKAAQEEADRKAEEETQRAIAEENRKLEEERARAQRESEEAAKAETERKERELEAEKQRKEEELRKQKEREAAAAEAEAEAKRLEKEKMEKAAAALEEERRAAEELKARQNEAAAALETFKTAMLTGKISAEQVAHFFEKYVMFESETLGEKAAEWTGKWTAVKDAVSGGESAENHKAVIEHLKAERSEGMCKEGSNRDAAGEGAGAPAAAVAEGDSTDDSTDEASMDMCAALNKLSEGKCDNKHRCLGDIPEALKPKRGKKGPTKKMMTCEQAREQGLLTPKDTNYCACRTNDECVVNEVTEGPSTIYVCARK